MTQTDATAALERLLDYAAGVARTAARRTARHGLPPDAVALERFALIVVRKLLAPAEQRLRHELDDDEQLLDTLAAILGCYPPVADADDAESAARPFSSAG